MNEPRLRKLGTNGKPANNGGHAGKGGRSGANNPGSAGSAPGSAGRGAQKGKRTDDRASHDVKNDLKRKRASSQPARPASVHAPPADAVNKVVWSTEPPLDYISQVGQGTYGKVYKAVDRKTNKLFAMKRLRLETQHEGFPVTAAREIKLLQALRHRNIVRLSEIVVSKNEIYMALDYIEHDLAGLLQNTELEVLPAHAKSIIRQTLTALAFLHDRTVLHRDIKGSNLLITADGTVKLADFGLARYMDARKPQVRYTNRVITLWYRPPELLLGTEHYGAEVDVWGVGCLLIEVFNRTPLFHGKDELSQIQSIYSVMGAPTASDWPEHVELPWFYLIDSLVKPPAAPQFEHVFSGPSVTPACRDLATKMLAMNPAHRISASAALQHEYFKEEPTEQRLSLHTEKEWHDWEAKKRKREDEP